MCLKMQEVLENHRTFLWSTGESWSRMNRWIYVERRSEVAMVQPMVKGKVSSGGGCRRICPLEPVTPAITPCDVRRFEEGKTL